MEGEGEQTSRCCKIKSCSSIPPFPRSSFSAAPTGPGWARGAPASSAGERGGGRPHPGAVVPRRHPASPARRTLRHRHTSAPASFPPLPWKCRRDAGGGGGRTRRPGAAGGTGAALAPAPAPVSSSAGQRSAVTAPSSAGLPCAQGNTSCRLFPVPREML